MALNLQQAQQQLHNRVAGSAAVFARLTDTMNAEESAAFSAQVAQLSAAPFVLETTQADLDRAWECSVNGTWSKYTGQERAEALKASYLATLWAVGSLTGELQPGERPVLKSDPAALDRLGAQAEPGSQGTARKMAGLNSERSRAAMVLQRANDLPLLLTLYDRPAEVSRAILGKPSTDASGWVVPLAIVVAGAVYVAGAYFVSTNAAAVTDNYFQRRQDLQKLQAEHAQAVALIAAHAKREQEEGKTLPLDAATQSALAASDKRAAEIAQRSPAPVRQALDGAGSGGFKFGLGLGSGAVIAGGLALGWFLFRNHPKE
jgi:hypothetical protein